MMRPARGVENRQTGPVTIPAQIMVKDLADLLSASVNEIIRTLIASGIFASINEVISYDVASKVATELGFAPELAAVTAPTALAPRAMAAAAARMATTDPARQPRPPVVTVMGHVDHGKTSLLDAIRNTRVAAGEAGGITQHIGAYQVEIDGRKITFLDTPGHEAFTAMRARGAQVTDIAVIVVAADDGVMPQTIEAIDHARAAQVPIVVALNKMDKPGANPDHVKQQLADHEVVVEEYGGDVICVPVSAKKNQGIKELLEMILLVADLQDMRANPKGMAQGVVVEAFMAAQRGRHGDGAGQGRHAEGRRHHHRWHALRQGARDVRRHRQAHPQGDPLDASQHPGSLRGARRWRPSGGRGRREGRPRANG